MAEFHGNQFNLDFTELMLTIHQNENDQLKDTKQEIKKLKKSE